MSEGVSIGISGIPITVETAQQLFLEIGRLPNGRVIADSMIGLFVRGGTLFNGNAHFLTFGSFEEILGNINNARATISDGNFPEREELILRDYNGRNKNVNSVLCFLNNGFNNNLDSTQISLKRKALTVLPPRNTNLPDLNVEFCPNIKGSCIRLREIETPLVINCKDYSVVSV